jgi:hypothetical protein
MRTCRKIPTFREADCLHRQGMYVPVKSSVRNQKTNIDKLTAVITLNLIKCWIEFASAGGVVI